MNRLRTAQRAAGVAMVAAAALGSSFAVAGPLGLVVAADCLAIVALIIALAVTPGGVRERRSLRPGALAARASLARLVRGTRRGHALQATDFPTYAKISSDLGWALVSQWHYDHGIRPLLARLLQSVLAERHRVDAVADPARARRLVGDEIWPLVDPARPPSFDSQAPGADLRTLARIVDRLEQL